MAVKIPSKQINTTDGTLSTVQAGDTAVVGTAKGMAIKDHQHAVETGGSLTTIQAGAVAAEGAGTGLARETHVHGVETGTPVDVGTANDEGSGTPLARANHIHALSAGAKADVLESRRFAFGVQTDDFTTSAASSDSSDALTKKFLDGSASKRIGGDGSNPGVITTSPNNKIAIRERSTNDPLEDSQNRMIFGRLTAAETALAAATYTWNGTTTIATSADPSSELAIGEWIKLDADGAYFEVTNVQPTQVTISNPGGLTIPTGAGGSSKLDLTLSYYVEDATSSEIAHTFGAGETVDLLYVESLSLQDAPFNALQTGVAFQEILPASHTHVLADITDITASPAEINVLDGFTGTTAELNEITDGSDVAAATHHHDGRYPLRSLLTTKGDIYARGATAIGRLPVGSNDQVLVADSTQPLGLKYANPNTIQTGNHRQEAVTTQNITGTDTVLTDTLDYTPKANAALQLFLNGVKQEQGALLDYTVSGTAITWLAATGTAVDLETTDSLVAKYVSD